MPTTLLAATAALLTSFLVAAKAPVPVPKFTPEAFRAHVAFLADGLLEGRETGTRGNEIAARYVASQFEAYGLKPAGDQGSWYQQVTFQQTERGADRGSLTITGPGVELTFPHAKDVMVGIRAREPQLDIAAPLVFVGFGIVDSRFGIDDYKGLDVKGKIVVALRGFPKGLPSEEGAHMSSIKYEVADKQGAIGFLSIATLQSEKAQPWERILEYADEPAFAWVELDGTAHDDAPGIRAGASLHGAAADAVFVGSGHKLADLLLEADQEKGQPRGFALETRARVRSSSMSHRVDSPNVVAMLPGSDLTLAAQYVVLSAHLDHLGIRDAKAGDPPDADRIYNGALDNGAGIATLLEVARAAAAAPNKPRRSILFLASTAEEKGLLGADYFARHPPVPILSIVGNVDLDMPLLLYPFTDVIAFGANHSSLGKFVAQAVAPMQIKLSPDPMPEQGVFTRSDHYMLVRQGVPAVFLATGFANGGEKHWGEFLGGNYHSVRDDMSQSIDWNAGARFAEANYRITRAMADANTPPLWIQGDYFGDIFAPTAARALRN